MAPTPLQRLLKGRDTLLFSGGGLKVLAFCGALECLPRAHMTQFRTFVGLSAGSVVALSLALGFRPSEAARVLSEAGIAKSMESLSPSRMISEGSLLDPGPIMSAIAGLMRRSGFPADGTFADLRRHAPERQLRVVVATFDAAPRLMVIDADSAPDEQVLRTIRASTSVPLAFTPVHLAGHVCFDAGCVNNLCLFAGGQPEKLVALLVGEDAAPQCRGARGQVPGLVQLAESTVERLALLARAELVASARRAVVLRMPTLPGPSYHMFGVGDGEAEDVEIVMAQGAIGVAAAALAPEIAVLLCLVVAFGIL